MLRHLLRTPDRDHILGDLAEEHAAALDAGAGRLEADLWYWWQVGRSLSPTVLRMLGYPRVRGDRYDPRRASRSVRSAAFASSDHLQEAKQIFRGFRRRPAFPLLAVLTLGLGIGITTTTFAVAYGVLLRPLPLPKEDRLVSLRHIRLTNDRDGGAGTAPWVFARYRDASRTLDAAMLFRTERVHLTDGTPAEVRIAYVTPELGAVVGLPPVVGRWPTSADVGTERWVAVLSHSIWSTRYGRAPGVVGTTIHLDEEPVDVIGVAPPEAEFLAPPDVQIWINLWRPVDEMTAGWGWRGVGRLRDGATVEQLGAELDELLRTLGDALPQHRERVSYWYERFQVRPAPRPLLDDRVGTARRWIWLLLGASLIVLLVAVANVANLALARSLDRRTDMAVRAVLGAGRRGVARLFTMEAAMLVAASAVLGLGLTYVVLHALPALANGAIPRIRDVRLDGSVAGAGLLLAAVSALTLVIVAWVGVPRMLAPTLRGATQGSSLQGRRAQHVLVVSQIGLAAVLVVFGGLMGRTFWSLRTLDLGFRAEGLYTFQLRWPTRSDGAADKHDFFRRLEERMENVPGLVSVSASECVPLRCPIGARPAHGEGQVLEDEDERPLVRVSAIVPGYFATLGIGIVSGRDLTWDDAGTAVDPEEELEPVVISESTAEALFPDRDPLGRRVFLEPGGREVVVVGIVSDVTFGGLGMGPDNGQLILYRADPRYDGMQWMVRTSMPLNAVLPSIRQAVWDVDPAIPVEGARGYDHLLTEATMDRTLILLLAMTGAGITVALGLVGIYGVLAHEVHRRRRELGIRTALGADARTLRGAVLRQATLLVAVGLSLGLAVSAASGRLFENVLYGVSPLDRMTYLAAAGLMTALGIVAAYVPAARASSVDPMEALRTE